MKSIERERELVSLYEKAMAQLLALELAVGDEASARRILDAANKLELYSIVLGEQLWMIDNEDDILKVVNPLIAGNEKQAQQYRDGNEKLWGFFFGRAMRALNGRANPETLTEILNRTLKG